MLFQPGISSVSLCECVGVCMFVCECVDVCISLVVCKCLCAACMVCFEEGMLIASVYNFVCSM